MADTVTLSLVVANIADVIAQFNVVKVYVSAYGALGPWTELTTPATRIALVPNTTVYEFDDPAGSASKYYTMTYYNTTSLLESSMSTPIQGTGDSALSVISVADLKTNYLIGLDMTINDGTPFPDSLFEFYIKAAVSWIEKQLDMAIRPTPIIGERHHYYPRDFQNYGAIQLCKFPLISVQQMRAQIPGQVTPQIFDPTWIQVDERWGTLHLIPTGTYTLGGGQPFMGPGTYYPFSNGWLRNDYAPNAFQVDYTAGFLPGQVPMELVELIAKTASFGPLNIAGDLLGGAGVASFSLSLDGLSQSINTTSSPMFSGYGARLSQYTKEIADQIPTLRKYYKGVPMVCA